MNINIEIGIFILLFMLYWCLLSRLVDVILESPRLKQMHWFLVGGINALILFGINRGVSNKLWVYVIMMTIMLLEFMIFYKDGFLGALLCTLACSIHIIGITTTVVAIFSMKMGYTPYETLGIEQFFLWCCICSFFLLNIAILVVVKVVPLSKVRLLNQHKEQQWFMIAWMVVSNLFLIYMANLFHRTDYPKEFSGSQIIASIASMLGLYIVLFFSIKTSTILGYKEKNTKLKHVIQEEQQYRNSIARDAIASYEVNVTQDLMIKGFEDHYNELSGEVHYSDMLVAISQKLIYEEDIAEYVNNYSRANILQLFEKGERELIAEYRRLWEHKEYIWVRSIIHMVQDLENGDIKAFICVKNMDAEKRNQLELERKAERDLLTGLYNKTTTGKIIDEYLVAFLNRENAAIFMIDVDNFKSINDHLGHVFGDAVLCELADKLVEIFRKMDIIGRIGGDEFIVFLKSDATEQVVVQKAMQICKAFQMIYEGVGGKKYMISSSVGICFFPKDGITFQELYGNADIALYEAKNNGKNGYKIYDKDCFSGYTSQRTEIQTIGNISQKGFRENRIEYVFKMLYQSENPVSAIHSVLELVTRHFSFERGYIFETSKDGKTTNNTFEWCAEGIRSEIDNLKNVPIEAVATANAHFKKHGNFILKSLDELQPLEREVLEPQGIKSMFQFGIFDKNCLLGFVGFDNCKSEMVPTDTEIDEMNTICNILATFFAKQYIDEISAKDLIARQEVMNHLDSYIYVIHTETFEVLFMNEKIQTLLAQSEMESTCYRFFRGEEEQCENCPLRELSVEGRTQIVSEIYNEKLKIWMETSASLMRWTDGTLACLISCSDITKQKEEHLNHVHQLEELVYVDTLTGCDTYYRFKEEAKKILEHQSEMTYVLVKLDIDHFKLINQMYGYEKGNEILCYVARAIEKTLRSENEIFARVANDEFIALFMIQDELEIEKLYANFLREFNELIGKEVESKCNFPHGRYIINPDNKNRLDINELFERVNTAHKEAKSDKTLEFTFYTESMTEKALYVKEIENRMKNALENNEFIVYLQPKYFLEDETIGGAEALVRWECENTNLFFPNAFIPIFEKNGFITKMDIYMFQKVCHIIKAWIEAGIEPVVISVNFSRIHLNNPNFIKELCDIADRIGVERKYLEIEITETVIYDNIEKLEILLNTIHRSGFTMSMDDFGSGYSSLGMLKDLPVDAIKMDRSFFVNQKNSKRSEIVIDSVIQMATKLGIQTVAEGVEEQEHVDFLRELHCGMVQGYYYAKPMPVEKLTTLMTDVRKN